MTRFSTLHDRRQPLFGRPAQVVLLLGFAVLLALPSADWAWGFDPSPPPQENRVLAAQPVRPLDLEAVARWPAAFEAWFRDHFGLRNSLIAWHSTLMLDVLGVSPSQDVLIGPDGWLDLGAAKNVDAYRCLAPYTPKDLTILAKELVRKRDWLAARGIRYVNLWVPIKSNVYPENLPPGLTKLDQPCRLQQWARYMQRHTDVPVMDATDALRMARAHGVARLYYKTDTHWNPRGAFAGYQAFVPLIRKQVPDMRVLRADGVEFVDQQENGGDLARLMDLVERYRTVEPRLFLKDPRSHRVQPGVTRPKGIKLEAYDCPTCGKARVVMTHDSFGNGLIPYFAESFGHFLAAEFAGFDEALFEAEKPDLVIEVHLERQLTPER
jgi:alginate O-acetyltransferase complex protein AlgJ